MKLLCNLADKESVQTILTLIQSPVQTNKLSGKHCMKWNQFHFPVESCVQINKWYIKIYLELDPFLSIRFFSVIINYPAVIGYHSIALDAPGRGDYKLIKGLRVLIMCRSMCICFWAKWLITDCSFTIINEYSTENLQV